MEASHEVFLSKVASQAAREALDGAKRLHRDDLSNIALAAAKEAVRETHAELFALLGINIADFDDIRQLRSDLEFLKTLHTGSVRVGGRITMAVIMAIVGAILLAFWWGATHMPSAAITPEVPRLK